LQLAIAVYDEFFSCMCAAEFLCALDVFAHHTSSRITGEEFIIYLADGKYFHSVVMFYLRKRITLKICI
jgi:hypothetical protein